MQVLPPSRTMLRTQDRHSERLACHSIARQVRVSSTPGWQRIVSDTSLPIADKLDASTSAMTSYGPKVKSARMMPGAPFGLAPLRALLQCGHVLRRRLSWLPPWNDVLPMRYRIPDSRRHFDTLAGDSTGQARPCPFVVDESAPPAGQCVYHASGPSRRNCSVISLTTRAQRAPSAAETHSRRKRAGSMPRSASRRPSNDTRRMVLKLPDV